MAEVKKRFFGKYAVIVASLVFLNFVGITYAHFNNIFEINGLIFTGQTNMEFGDTYHLEDIAGTGDITVSFQRDEKNNQTIMNIQGRVEPGYQGKLYFYTENNGSIPLVFKEENILSNDGIDLQLEQSKTGDSELEIHVPSNLRDGTYSFEMELYYQQWNS